MKNKESMENRCVSCKYWNNKQAELEYSKNYGICTCYKWKFDITRTGDCVLLDRQNRNIKYMGVNRFESQSETVPICAVENSRYCFVTEEEFGCIHYTKS